MSIRTFTIKDIEILNSNSNVLRVSEKSITYSDEFKRHFIEEYLSGKISLVIFGEAGFDVDMIGMKCVVQSAESWLKLTTMTVLSDLVMPAVKIPEEQGLASYRQRT